MKSWQSYASDSGILRLRPKLLSWGAGVWGSLALGNPPSAHDVDAWEASKPSGVWDYYEFLAFVTLPAAAATPSSLVLCFAASTFFERSGEVIATIPLTTACREVFETTWLDDDEFLRAAWEQILAILNDHYGSADLDDQVWSIDGHTFTASDPDQ